MLTITLRPCVKSCCYTDLAGLACEVAPGIFHVDASMADHPEYVKAMGIHHISAATYTDLRDCWEGTPHSLLLIAGKLISSYYKFDMYCSILSRHPVDV